MDLTESLTLSVVRANRINGRKADLLFADEENDSLSGGTGIDCIIDGP